MCVGLNRKIKTCGPPPLSDDADMLKFGGGQSKCTEAFLELLTRVRIQSGEPFWF